MQPLPNTHFEPADSKPSLRSSTDLALGLARGLSTPAAALRCALNDLCNPQLPESEKRAVMQAAARGLERLEDNLGELISYLAPLDPKCDGDRLSLLLHSSLTGLPRNERARVWVAYEADARQCVFEGDSLLAIRSLTRLLQNALEASPADVLVQVTRSADQLQLQILSRSTGGPFSFDWSSEAFHSTKRGQLGLGLTLARRDLEQMGARLHVERSDNGWTRTRVTKTMPTDLGGAA